MAGGVLRGRARRWGCAALLAGALLLAARPGPPAALQARLQLPARPAHLSHLLADFSTHPSLLSTPVSSWTIENEASNYTSWRYSVAYECGARCSGRAHVAAHEAGARPPRPGPAAAAHRVLVRNTLCVTLPLLPWTYFCAELETTTLVTADEATNGALMEERASVRCGRASALVLGALCTRRGLRALRDDHVRRVRARLHPRTRR